MSRAASPSGGVGGTARAVSIEVKIGEALGQVAFMPAAVQGAMRTALFDLLSHHRRSVIKQAATWPGKRRAQRMVASRLHRFTRASEQDAGISGQAFAAAVKGETFGPDAFKRYEEGQSVGSSDPFVIPIGAGKAMAESNIKGRRQQFRDLLKSDKVMLVRGGGKTFVVRILKGRGRKQRGLRNELLGIVARRRTEQPRLKFRATFDRVAAQDLPKLDRVLEAGVTVAGRKRLRDKEANLARGREAFSRTFRQYLDAHPRRFGEARKVAMQASREARGIVDRGGGRA